MKCDLALSNSEEDEFELKSSYSKGGPPGRMRPRGWSSRQMDLVGHEKGSQLTLEHTSVRRCAVMSLMRLWWMEGKAPLG